MRKKGTYIQAQQCISSCILYITISITEQNHKLTEQ